MVYRQQQKTLKNCIMDDNASGNAHYFNLSVLHLNKYGRLYRMKGLNKFRTDLFKIAARRRKNQIFSRRI